MNFSAELWIFGVIGNLRITEIKLTRPIDKLKVSLQDLIRGPVKLNRVQESQVLQGLVSIRKAWLKSG